MKLDRILLALVLLATLAAPAGAHATITNDPAFQAAVQRVAEGQFPNSPCAGRVVAEFNADIASYLPPGETALGIAWRDECRLAIATLSDPQQWCEVYAHEYGHLAGYGHEDRRVADGAMRTRTRWDTPYRPCLRAAGRVVSGPAARRAVRREVRAEHPGARRLRVTCRATASVDRRVCRARWSGGTERYQVQRTAAGVEVSAR